MQRNCATSGIAMHGAKRDTTSPSLTMAFIDRSLSGMENKKISIQLLVSARSRSSILLGKKDIQTRHCENEFDSSQLVVIKNNDSLGARRASSGLRNQRGECKCTVIISDVNITFASGITARAIVTALAVLAFVCNKFKKFILNYFKFK